MNIRFRTVGPVVTLGLIALGAVASLLWVALAALPGGAASGGQSITAAHQLASVRETQRIASALAAAERRLGEAPDGLHRMLHETVASVMSDVEEMRVAAAGQDIAAEIDRLAAETGRWRDAVERAGHAGQAATRPLAPDVLAAQGTVVARLLDGLADRIETGEVRRRQAALLRTGGAAAAVLGLTILCLAGAAAAAGRRLSSDMARLPHDLRAFAQGDAAGPLPGEARGDEFGALARALRTMAETMQDLTQSRAEMERMALTDPLTGLPNRRGLYDFLDKRGGRRAWPECGSVGVLHIDFDHFKTVNDANGHEAGDHVLREATRRMAMVIRETDILARLGGDEFVIFVHGLTSLASLQGLAERVIRQFDAPIVFGDRTFRVTATASAGAVLGGRNGRVHDPKRLLVNADIALAHAKATGRNRCSIFTSTMARDARRRQEHASEIRDGVARGEFRIWFRPVVDVPTGRTAALDLVPRWHHPDRGVLPAGAFMPAAEAHGLTEALGLPVLEQALREVTRWRDAGLAVPRLHIGMSRTLLLAPSILDRFVRMLDAGGIEPDGIAISVSEVYCGGRGAEAVHTSIRRFAELGATVLIDDFGSVDAALGSVTKLGADQIRLNVARTAGLVDGDQGSDPVDRARMQAMLPGIIGIGESLGVQVLAKGVDTDKQVACLLSRGFAVMQGDALAPLMEVTAAGAWLSRRAERPLQAATG